MYQNLNQISQTPVKGEVKGIPNPTTVSCQFNPNSIFKLVAASPVKLISGTSQQLMVDLANDTDNILGFVIYYDDIISNFSRRQQKYVKTTS